MKRTELEHIGVGLLWRVAEQPQGRGFILDVNKGTSDADRRASLQGGGTVVDRFALLWNVIAGKKEPDRIVFDRPPRVCRCAQ